MVWKETIRKLSYYSNLPLFSRTFFTLLKISLSSKSTLISLANPRQNGKTEEKEKIVKYARLCLHLRRRLGFKDTCLTSSILLCNLLRQYGIDARVNFSARKDNEKMAGHSWVSVGEEKISSDYRLIFRYP